MTAHTQKLVLCAAVLGLMAPRAVLASEADAFENKVRPVSGQLYQKSGKLELTVPSGVLSLNDAFFTKYMAGVRLGYHLNEYFYVGVSGAYGGASQTGSTQVCPVNQGCHPATNAQLYQVPGYVRWTAAAEVAFSPVYAKLNLVAQHALHFDLSLIGGVDLVSYRDVLTATQANTAGASPGDASSPGGHLGVGARFFFARFMALRMELRDVLYSVSSLDRGKLQNQLFAEAGLSFFIPVAHNDAQ